MKLKLPRLVGDDFRAYPHHTDGAIKGIKLIASLSKSTVLRAARGANNEAFRAILSAMGKKTNPNWIIGQCAEEALRKGWMSEEEFERRRV